MSEKPSTLKALLVAVAVIAAAKLVCSSESVTTTTSAPPAATSPIDPLAEFERRANEAPLPELPAMSRVEFLGELRRLQADGSNTSDSTPSVCGPLLVERLPRARALSQRATSFVPYDTGLREAARLVERCVGCGKTLRYCVDADQVLDELQDAAWKEESKR